MVRAKLGSRTHGEASGVRERQAQDDEAAGMDASLRLSSTSRIGPVESALADHLGSGLGKLTEQNWKLCIVTENRASPPALIRRNVGISKDYNIFELRTPSVRGTM